MIKLRIFMNNRATILIITLWVLTLLSAVALSITYRMRIELKLAKAELGRTESFWIAKAGLLQVLAVLNQDSNRSYDALNEKWSNYTEQIYKINPFREISVGKGRFNVSYVYGKDIFSGYEQVFYGMEDEERKINVNKATQDMLESIGLAPEIATSIRAWRGDPELGEGVLLKEGIYYKGLAKPYDRKGKDIEHIEELLLVRGITPEMLFGKDMDASGGIDINEAGLTRYFTVYGDGLVNINTASVTVLRALGLGEDLSYKILRYRLGPDETLGTMDDGVFTDTGRIGTDLAYMGEPLLPDEERQLTKAKPLLKVTSRYYTAYIEGKVPGECRYNVRATLDKEAGEGNQVVKWYGG